MATKTLPQSKPTAVKKPVAKKKATKVKATKVKAKASSKTPVKTPVVKDAGVEKQATHSARRQHSLHGHNATSLRGVKRNLGLEGHKTLEVRKDPKKGFLVFKGAAKTGKVVLHDGQPIKSVASLTYGQWVTAAVKAATK